jgi:uncharacterized protein (DUF2141 family)
MKVRKRFFFEKKNQKTFTTIGLIFTATFAQAATVQVSVHDVRNDHGRVLVAICERADFLRPHCPYKGSAPAQPGTVIVSIKSVPPGLYAAEAFHDENDNGHLDRSFFGLPEEGMGFSNNAPMHLGPPRFEVAAFTVSPAGATIDFSLRYRF